MNKLKLINENKRKKENGEILDSTWQAHNRVSHRIGPHKPFILKMKPMCVIQKFDPHNELFHFVTCVPHVLTYHSSLPDISRGGKNQTSKSQVL